MLAGIQKTGLFRNLIQAQAVKRAARCQLRDPLAAQRLLFKELLATAALTQFGRDNNFARLTDISFTEAYRSFKRRVPIRSYQEFMAGI